MSAWGHPLNANLPGRWTEDCKSAVRQSPTLNAVKADDQADEGDPERSDFTLGGWRYMATGLRVG